MKKVLIAVLICLLPVALEAKPKKKLYNNSAEQLFAATLRTARERHVVTFVDSKQLMITFETGMSFWSVGFVANASVEPEGQDKATLIINVQNKKGLSMGAGDRMADKFFNQVSETLSGDVTQKNEVHPEEKSKSVPPPKATPTEPVMAKPAEGTAQATPVSTGTIWLACKMETAEVFVDDEFTGNPPAYLKLKPGKHTISVTAKGMKKWSRTLTVTEGSEVKLMVELELAETTPSTTL